MNMNDFLGRVLTNLQHEFNGNDQLNAELVSDSVSGKAVSVTSPRKDLEVLFDGRTQTTTISYDDTDEQETYKGHYTGNMVQLTVERVCELIGLHDPQPGDPDYQPRTINEVVDDMEAGGLEPHTEFFTQAKWDEIYMEYDKALQQAKRDKDMATVVTILSGLDNYMPALESSPYTGTFEAMSQIHAEAFDLITRDLMARNDGSRA